MSKDQVYRVCVSQCMLIIMMIAIVRTITFTSKLPSQVALLGSSNKKSNPWKELWNLPRIFKIQDFPWLIQNSPDAFQI